METQITRVGEAYSEALTKLDSRNGVAATKLMTVCASKYPGLGLVHYATATVIFSDALGNLNGPKKVKEKTRAVGYARKATELNPNSLVYSYFYILTLFYQPNAYFDLVVECERALALNEPDEPLSDMIGGELENAWFRLVGNTAVTDQIRVWVSKKLFAANVVGPQLGLSVEDMWKPEKPNVWIKKWANRFGLFKKKLLQVPLSVLKDYYKGVGATGKHLVHEALTFVESHHRFCFLICFKCDFLFRDLCAYRDHFQLHYPPNYPRNPQTLPPQWAETIKGFEWFARDMIKSLNTWSVKSSTLSFSHEKWLRSGDAERQKLVAQIGAAFDKLVSRKFLTMGNLESVMSYISNVVQRVSYGQDMGIYGLETMLLSICLLGSSDLKYILELLDGLVKVSDSFYDLKEEQVCDGSFGALGITPGDCDLKLDHNKRIGCISLQVRHDDICSSIFTNPPVEEVFASWMQSKEDRAKHGNSLYELFDNKMKDFLDLTETLNDNVILEKEVKKMIAECTREKYEREFKKGHIVKSFASLLLGHESLLNAAKSMARSVSAGKAPEGDFLESCIEIVLRNKRTMLVYERNMCDAKVMKVHMEIGRISERLESASEGDFRPFLIALVKPYLLAHLDSLEDHPEEEGVDTSREKVQHDSSNESEKENNDETKKANLDKLEENPEAGVGTSEQVQHDLPNEPEKENYDETKKVQHDSSNESEMENNDETEKANLDKLEENPEAGVGTSEQVQHDLPNEPEKENNDETKKAVEEVKADVALSEKVFSGISFNTTQDDGGWSVVR